MPIYILNQDTIIPIVMEYFHCSEKTARKIFARHLKHRDLFKFVEIIGVDNILSKIDRLEEFNIDNSSDENDNNNNNERFEC